MPENIQDGQKLTLVASGQLFFVPPRFLMGRDYPRRCSEKWRRPPMRKWYGRARRSDVLVFLHELDFFCRVDDWMGCPIHKCIFYIIYDIWVFVYIHVFAYLKCSVVPLQSKIQHNTSMCTVWLESARVAWRPQNGVEMWRNGSVPETWPVRWSTLGRHVSPWQVYWSHLFRNVGEEIKLVLEIAEWFLEETVWYQ